MIDSQNTCAKKCSILKTARNLHEKVARVFAKIANKSKFISNEHRISSTPAAWCVIWSN